MVSELAGTSITLVGCVVTESELQSVSRRGDPGARCSLAWAAATISCSWMRSRSHRVHRSLQEPICPAATLSVVEGVQMKGKTERLPQARYRSPDTVSGIQMRAEVRTSGSEATGGNTAGPQNFDLEVFEVIVASDS